MGFRGILFSDKPTWITWKPSIRVMCKAGEQPEGQSRTTEWLSDGAYPNYKPKLFESWTHNMMKHRHGYGFGFNACQLRPRINWQLISATHLSPNWMVQYSQRAILWLVMISDSHAVFESSCQVQARCPKAPGTPWNHVKPPIWVNRIELLTMGFFKRPGGGTPKPLPFFGKTAEFRWFCPPFEETSIAKWKNQCDMWENCSLFPWLQQYLPWRLASNYRYSATNKWNSNPSMYPISM